MGALAVKEKLASGPQNFDDAHCFIEVARLVADLHQERTAANDELASGQLLYNWNRYYDPRTGRYLSSDPMSVAQHVRKWMAGMRKGTLDSPPLELNSFTYVANNSLRWIDPTGLETLICSKLWHPHTFLCVDGTCSGKYPSGNPFFSPGEILDDAPNQSKASCSAVPVPKGCDEGSFDKCVVTKLLDRGPSGDLYNWTGANCGTWAQDVIQSCRNACSQPSTPGPQ